MTKTASVEEIECQRTEYQFKSEMYRDVASKIISHSSTLHLKALCAGKSPARQREELFRYMVLPLGPKPTYDSQFPWILAKSENS